MWAGPDTRIPSKDTPMTKYRVPFNTWAGGSITVDTDETDPEKILEEAYTEGIPSVCAQCSGWGRDFSLEIGDEWEENRDKEGRPVIYVEGQDEPYVETP